MFQFKTLFLFFFAFLSQASFAVTCESSYVVATNLCSDDSPDLSGAAVTFEQRNANAESSANYVLQNFAACETARRSCLVTCKKQYESSSSPADQDAAMNALVDCETGDIARNYMSLQMGVINARQLASVTSTQLSEATRGKESMHERSTGPAQGMTGLPMVSSSLIGL